eukprot:scaffold348976_cov14-Prasinocladus_malaysianus.AAC.1
MRCTSLSLCGVSESAEATRASAACIACVIGLHRVRYRAPLLVGLAITGTRTNTSMSTEN